MRELTPWEEFLALVAHYNAHPEIVVTPKMAKVMVKLFDEAYPELVKQGAPKSEPEFVTQLRVVAKAVVK